MKSIIFSLLVAVSLAACTNYGKKVKSGSIEVFYKNGVSEEQAKKTADLFESGTKGSARKSFQLTKPGDTVLMKMVVDKKKLEKASDDVLYALSEIVSDSIFNGVPVNLILTDDSFKPIRTLVFKKAEVIEPEKEETALTMDDFDHDVAAGINFYWKGISDEESKTIADYIVKNGSFSGGNVSIVMTKESDRYILKFPITESASNDASYMTGLEKVIKEIKDNVFANVPFSFVATDERLNTVKSWDY